MDCQHIEVECALCGQRIDPSSPLFRTSGSFLPPGDPLIPFCNSPLHWSCYAKWPERPRFARRYVEAWVKANRRNPFWWSVYRDEHVYVSVNPSAGIEEASVRLFATGSDIRVRLARWAEWLEHMDAVTPGLHAQERHALVAVLPLLRQRLPDDHAVVDAIDPDEKRPAPRRTFVNEVV